MKPIRPYLIGLTGGIASGKSQVAQWFAAHGIEVVHFDELGHQVLQDAAVVQRLQDAFGPEVCPDGKICREALGRVVYHDAEKRQQLNGIMHPAIRTRAQQKIDACRADYLVLEIPLLFESNLEQCVDLSLLVTADLELRIERLCLRDGIDEHYARTKIASQMDEAEKQARADILLPNNGTPAQLHQACEVVFTGIQKRKRRAVKRFDEIALAQKED
jgi:dephospho-CoA kinase